MHCAIWSIALVVTTKTSTLRVTHWVQMALACPRSPFGSCVETFQPNPSKAFFVLPANRLSIGDVASNWIIPRDLAAPLPVESPAAAVDVESLAHPERVKAAANASAAAPLNFVAFISYPSSCWLALRLARHRPNRAFAHERMLTATIALDSTYRRNMCQGIAREETA